MNKIDTLPCGCKLNENEWLFKVLNSNRSSSHNIPGTSRVKVTNLGQSSHRLLARFSPSCFDPPKEKKPKIVIEISSDSETEN